MQISKGNQNIASFAKDRTNYPKAENSNVSLGGVRNFMLLMF